MENFAFFLNWKSRFDSELKDHIDHSSENAKYTSPQIQNEIVLCEQVIREQILKTIPKYWSIIADETQDCWTTDQISLCIRYTNSDNEVCEEFVGFIKVEKMDTQSISDALISALLGRGLDMSYPVGQGYDEASVMSSSKNGVETRVPAQYPNATYVHCRSHVLNLAISSGCKSVPSIRNLFDNVGELTWFWLAVLKGKKYFLKLQ